MTPRAAPRTALRPLVLLTIVVLGASCRHAAPAQAPAEAAPPPYSPALAARVEALLPVCHAGLLARCNDLGKELLAAGYWQEAASVFGYACWLPPAAGHAEECTQYLDGRCAPDACSCAGQPGCPVEPWECEPSQRESLCGDGSHAACVQREQVSACRIAANALDRWSLRRDNDTDAVCSDLRMRVLHEAAGFSRRVCEEFPPDVTRRWQSMSGHDDDVCVGLENDRAEIRDCEDERRRKAEHEATMAAMDAQFRADLGRQLAAGIGDIAGTVRQIDAANQGKIVGHQRVEIPTIRLDGTPSATAIGDALVAHAPAVLRRVARLHPRGDALFAQSANALLLIRRELLPRSAAVRSFDAVTPPDADATPDAGAAAPVPPDEDGADRHEGPP